MKFWAWFLRGSGSAPGYRRYFDPWLPFHLGVGTLMAWLLPVTLKDAASAVLLPLAGALVGLSFAWGGNAQALLQSEEIDKLADHHPGGFEEYVYTYQAAVLAILSTIIVWGIAGIGLFDLKWPTQSSKRAYFLICDLLFSLSSLTIRECWHVVLGAQMMILARRRIKKQIPRGEQKTAQRS